MLTDRQTTTAERGKKVRNEIMKNVCGRQIIHTSEMWMMMSTCYSFWLRYLCHVYKSTKRNTVSLTKWYLHCVVANNTIKILFFATFQNERHRCFSWTCFETLFLFLRIKSRYSKINRFNALTALCTQLCTQQYRTQCLVLHFIDIARKRWRWTRLKWFFFAMSFETGARTLRRSTRNRA